VCLVVCVAGVTEFCHAQATVNESLETAFLYVDGTAGSDSNPGTQQAPLKTIGKAASMALTNNYNSIGTRVTINPGTYRESLSLTGVSQDTSYPITFEAATNGTVIMSGAVVYTGWAVYSGNSSIYTNTWNNTWGLCPAVNGCPALQNISARQEMIIVNGVPLTQVLSYGQMLQGTFYVDTTHSTAYVWPASGTNMSTATVEVASLSTLVAVHGKSNLVFRGLVFQYANTCRGLAAVAVNGSATNVLFDTDAFQWNNAEGLSLSYPVTYFTVENSTAVHNGDSGFQESQTKYGLWQSDTTGYNNWRGAQGSYYECDAAGMHVWEAHDDTLNSVNIIYNQAWGAHWDTDNQNITATSVIAANNLEGGLYAEKDEGPITFNTSYACNQTSPLAEGGLELANSEQVSFTNGVLLNNSPGDIYVIGTAGGVPISNWETGQTYTLYTQNLTTTGDTIQANGTTQQVLNDGYLNGTDWTNFQTTLVSNNNIWWDANTTTVFNVPSPHTWTLDDLSSWQSLTGQDAASSFKAPSGNPGSACTFTPDMPDFWTTVMQPSLTMDMTGTAVYNYTLTPLNFAGTVNLTLDGISEVSGLTASLVPSTLTTSGSSVLTVTAATNTAAGTYPITVLANSGNMTRTVTMSLVIPSTSLRLSAIALAWGSQQQNTTGSSQAVTLQNFGKNSVSITSITSNTANFTVSHNCGTSLAAGRSCTITVTFTPQWSGALTGTITITDGDPTSPQLISLSGTGTPAPTASMTPNNDYFGTHTVGTSTSIVSTLTNTSSSVSLNITSITITGTNPGDFAQTNSCPGSLAAGSSCTFTVTFTPTTTGTRTATVSVIDNRTKGNNNIALQGTGK
jgi:hypothetical protein